MFFRTARSVIPTWVGSSRAVMEAWRDKKLNTTIWLVTKVHFDIWPAWSIYMIVTRQPDLAPESDSKKLIEPCFLEPFTNVAHLGTLGFGAGVLDIV